MECLFASEWGPDHVEDMLDMILKIHTQSI